MRILWDATVHTVEQAVAILSTMPPGLPLEVYAAEGGYTLNRGRGVCISHVTDDDGGGERVCIESND